MPNPQNKKGLFQFYPHNLVWVGLSIVAIILDQWTKWFATTHLNYADPVPVLPFLNWTLLHNYGAAFSFLSDAGGWQRYFFTSLAALVSVIFVFWLMRMPKKIVILPMAIALILGGAIGNLIDRVWLGKVTDMFWIRAINFPVFNIADTCITFAAVLLGVLSIRAEAAASPAKVASPVQQPAPVGSVHEEDRPGSA